MQTKEVGAKDCLGKEQSILVLALGQFFFFFFFLIFAFLFFSPNECKNAPAKVCSHVSALSHTQALLHIWKHTLTQKNCTCKRTHVHIHARLHSHIFACIRTCILNCIFTCMNNCLHTHISLFIFLPMQVVQFFRVFLFFLSFLTQTKKIREEVRGKAPPPLPLLGLFAGINPCPPSATFES